MSQWRQGIPVNEIHDCQERIKNSIAARCGTKDCIETDDGIAFSGSREEPELLLTVGVVKHGEGYCLYADLDDEVSWQEWDFTDRTAFENDVADYIAVLVDRTIKTVTEKKRRKYLKRSRYYLNEQQEWVLIDEEVLTMRWLRLFLNKDSVEETVKTYRIM